jgi:hypothetical protein
VNLLALTACLVQLASVTAPTVTHTERLARALALDLSGDGGAANAALAALSDASESRQALGLDLVEAWWRVSHRERAINTLSKWRQEAPRSPDPLVRARERALTGSPYDVELLWRALSAAPSPEDARCRLLPVARSLDAVGQREAGQRLLERAWSELSCPDAVAQRASWERPRRPTVEPVPLPLPLAVRHVLGPGNEARIVGIMPEQAEELPQGVGLIDLSIPEDAVEAHYGPLSGASTDCATAPLCVTLHHASTAQPGDRLVGVFALRVGGVGQVVAEGLLDGISRRITAEGDWDPWRTTTEPQTPQSAAKTAEGPAPPEQVDDRERPWLWLAGLLALAVGLIALARRRSGVPPAR